jgi:hypothetical protein
LYIVAEKCSKVEKLDLESRVASLLHFDLPTNQPIGILTEGHQLYIPVKLRENEYQIVEIN